MDFSNQNIENMFIKYISSFIDKNHVGGKNEKIKHNKQKYI